MSTISPLERLRDWIEAAEARGLPSPTTAILATVDPDGQPSTRSVTLRPAEGEGLLFATTLYSRKGRDIAANPRVSLHLSWPKCGQVHIAGSAALAPDATSQELYAAKGEGGRRLIRAARQGAEIESLEKLRSELEAAELSDSELATCPPDWGGVTVTPHAMEFWTPGKGGLHERHLYARSGSAWSFAQLTP